MKKSPAVFALFWATVAFLFGSCKNDDPANNTASAIIGKWEIKDINSPYTSFEFLPEGYYIVTNRKSDSNARHPSVSPERGFFGIPKNLSGIRKGETVLSPFHFGKYSIDGNKITLSGFGLVEPVTITGDEFNFSFTLESTGQKDSYVANISKTTVSSSEKTDMFCKVWEIDKVRIDFTQLTEFEATLLESVYGDDWKVKLLDEYNVLLKGLTMLSSKAGTYLLLAKPVNGSEGNAGLAEWKWTSPAETAIHYSWDNWAPGWEETNVEINNLTNSGVTIVENAISLDMKRKN